MRLTRFAPTADDLREQIEDGIPAENALEVYGPILDQRQAAELDALVVWFLTKPWDPNVALRHCASLGEIRKQRDELTYKANRSQRARTQLFDRGE